MSRLLAELEIDAACWEFIARRVVANGGQPPPQPIVQLLDSIPPEDGEEDPDWDELTARAEKMYPAPGAETSVEIVERVLGRTGI